MKPFYVFYFLLLIFMAPVAAQSVCQEQLVATGDESGTMIGQSIFMSGCDGFFSSISFSRSDDGAAMAAQLTIFNGQTFIGTPLYTQAITIPEGAGLFMIDLDSGTGELSFFEDSQYTFMLSAAALQLDSSNDVDSYTDGQLFVDLGFINNDDLWFQLRTTSTLGIATSIVKQPVLFPNPAKDRIQISGILGSEAFKIYNNLGVLVMGGAVESDASIGVENLPAGMYYLKLNAVKAFKFLKQ